MNISVLQRLRQQEQALVDSIRQEITTQEPGTLVAYLPNLLPSEQADFIVVAMEPSLAWAKGCSESQAQDRVQEGNRNFIFSWEDFILHYCLKHYLGSYYITDISKAAMPKAVAARWSSRLYPRWLPLLEQEIELFGTERPLLIPLGKKVEAFLRRQCLPWRVAPSALHYSREAANSRKKWAELQPGAYQEFCKHLSSATLEALAEERLQSYFEAERSFLGNPVPEAFVQKRLQDLRGQAHITESQKMLMFTYFKQFGALRRTISGVHADPLYSG